MGFGVNFMGRLACGPVFVLNPMSDELSDTFPVGAYAGKPVRRKKITPCVTPRGWFKTLFQKEFQKD